MTRQHSPPWAPEHYAKLVASKSRRRRTYQKLWIRLWQKSHDWKEQSQSSDSLVDSMSHRYKYPSWSTATATCSSYSCRRFLWKHSHDALLTLLSNSCNKSSTNLSDVIPDHVSSSPLTRTFLDSCQTQESWQDIKLQNPFDVSSSHLGHTLYFTHLCHLVVKELIRLAAWRLSHPEARPKSKNQTCAAERRSKGHFQIWRAYHVIIDPEKFKRNDSASDRITSHQSCSMTHKRSIGQQSEKKTTPNRISILIRTVLHCQNVLHQPLAIADWISSRQLWLNRSHLRVVDLSHEWMLWPLVPHRLSIPLSV